MPYLREHTQTYFCTYTDIDMITYDDDYDNNNGNGNHNFESE